MIIVYLIIFILGLVSYFKKKYVVFLFAYLALLTNLLMLDRWSSHNYGQEFCIVINLLIIGCRAFLRDKRGNVQGNKLREDCPKNTTIIILFLAFYALEFIRTIFIGAESIFMAVKVIRLPLIILVYYPLKNIPLSSYSRFFRYGLYLTLVLCLFYLLQFANIYLISGYSIDENSEFNHPINIPFWIVIFLFYLLKTKRFTLSIKVVFSLILLLTMFLALVRGIIIGTLAGIIVYLFLNRHEKQSRYFLIIFILLLPIVGVALETKSSKVESQSTAEDIRNVVRDLSGTVDYVAGSGSFSFRIGMLVERAIYLIDNPQYVLLGVGAIHEDSPYCINRFDFVLGTANKDKPTGKCQIDSGDITWVPILLRYGIIGVIIHLFFFIYIIKNFWHKNDILQIAVPTYIEQFLISFDGAYFEKGLFFFEFALFLAMFARTHRERKQIW